MARFGLQVILRCRLSLRFLRDWRLGLASAPDDNLLYSRGQTIGKRLMNIQIVDFATGQQLPFSRVYVYRYLWTMPLFFIVMIIPGTIDDMLINLVVLVDSLMIFGASRRCLHDLIAGSKVVIYKEGRPNLA